MAPNYIFFITSIVLILEFPCYTSRLYRAGRHVCSKEETVRAPVQRTQTICRPVYKSYLKLCDGYRLCKAFRVVYERAYQTVYQVETKTQKVMTCCPGWSRYSPQQNGCMTPICKNVCRNNGQCVKPDRCRCSRGWTGPSCEEDLDECKVGRHDCQQICRNSRGSFTCSCHEGFRLSADKKTCELCLSCLPEYDTMVNGYHTLMERVNKLESEKDVLMGNLSTLQNDMHSMDEQLHYVMADKALVKRIPVEQPSTTAGPFYQDPEYIPFDRLASLSEQISILEERLEHCSCREDENEDNSQDPWGYF